MSLQGGANKLSDATKEMKARVQRAGGDWNDAAAERFHSRYIEPIEPKVRSAMSAMSRLAELVARARKECG